MRTHPACLPRESSSAVRNYAARRAPRQAQDNVGTTLARAAQGVELVDEVRLRPDFALPLLAAFTFALDGDRAEPQCALDRHTARPEVVILIIGARFS